MREDVIQFKELLNRVLENHGCPQYKALSDLINHRIRELREENDEAGRLIFQRNQGQIAALKWVNEMILATRPVFAQRPSATDPFGQR